MGNVSFLYSDTKCCCKDDYKKKKKIVNKDFVERLQLAVTEVNGCAACSYAHTYMALK